MGYKEKADFKSNVFFMPLGHACDCTKSKWTKFPGNKTDTIIAAMLIVVSIFIFFATALALMILKIYQPNARYAWLVAVGGAMLALVSIFIWLAQMPAT